MSDRNIAAKSQEERDKVNVDLAASGVAYKPRFHKLCLFNAYCMNKQYH
ncbi:hypothetical protein GNX52_003445 [Escherichia coli]|nr:hypothetical protein [Escherichia coli]EHU0689763.1 hypothetical protein [Escherichia coli]